ncbi:MAG: DUF4159 domain-containing protein [Candidatus Latescibacteria bacterium]|nr:DUF4159 domain-containing protein [Candidatus Latescibacterota bacterium]
MKKTVIPYFLLLSVISAYSFSESPPNTQRGMIYIDPENTRDVRGYIHLAIIWGETLLPPPFYPKYLINLKEAFHTWTDMNVTLDRPLKLDSPRLLEMPFVYLTTYDAFELTLAEKENVKKYFENGGFMVLDNARPTILESPQELSMKRLLSDALGEKAHYGPIPANHPILKIYFDMVEGPPIGVDIGPLSYEKLHVTGVWIDNKLTALLSNRGYTVRWNNDSDNQPQLRFGINMVIFALIQAELNKD